MSGRGEILARVRAAAEGRGGPEASREEAVAQRLLRHPEGLVPLQAKTSGPGRMAQFLNKLDQASVSVSRISAIGELPRAISRELRKRGQPVQVRMGEEPMFRDLNWSALDASRGPGRIEEPAALSRAEFGMAETGTLVLCSGPANPVTLTFLGETHFIVLRRGDLMAGLEDMWQAFRERGLDPRTVNMVTGPSRSGDIGQVLQMGAHGPMAVHLFLMD
jgi:L-lactate dehydrogenase complex protein LldG